jgi:amino acid permease
MLDQPRVYTRSGFILAIFMTFVAIIFIWLGCVSLVDAGISQKIFDYSDLAFHAYGMRGKRFVDVAIMIGNFGAIMSCILIIGEQSAQLMHSWGCTQDGCGEFTLTTFLGKLTLHSTLLFVHYVI